MDRWLLLIHLVVTAFMTGLIWFVQVVHYPLFASVGAERFAAYEALHTRHTTWVVGPAMFIELITAVMLVWRSGVGVSLGGSSLPLVPAFAAWMGLVMVGLLALITFIWSWPEHERLGSGFDAAAHGRLVGVNWLRTALWTARSVLAAWMIARLLPRVDRAAA